MSHQAKDAVYFAYGTLLDIKQMHNYCPSAEPAGIMRLKGYRLGFARCGPDPSVGGCTLVEDAGNVMYGILYRLPAQELADLDKASGVDKGLWAPRPITLIDAQEVGIPANTYIIPTPAGRHQPPESYTRSIFAGAKAWPLPESYIRQLEQIIRDAQRGE